ncbi:hypothetical protein ABKN59_008929 [Abortiporus biennis]
MASRRMSEMSFDTAAAEEALDFFDEQNISFRTSTALFGSSPRRISDAGSSHARRDSQTLPLRRASMDSLRRTQSNASTTTPPRARAASTQVKRPDSPDIETMIAKTPKPRRRTSSILDTPGTQSRAQSTLSLRSAIKEFKDDESIISDYGNLLDNDSPLEDMDGGSESDSSIDVHTPLPHLMFRDGLLSPRSKLLPQSLKESFSLEYMSGKADRATSALSMVSTTTKSGLQRDPRDTVRRRLRHRDGSLLRAGMGLTTGLGWSDSEDEDAPSLLTRRLISTTIERKRSASLQLSPSRPTSEYHISDTSFSRLTSPAPSTRSTTTPGRRPLQTSARSISISFPMSKTAPSTPSLGRKISDDFSLPTPIAELPDDSNLLTRERSGSMSSSSPSISLRNRSESITSLNSTAQSISSGSGSAADGTKSIMELPLPKRSTKPSISRRRTESGTSTSTFGFPRHRTTSSSVSASLSTSSFPRARTESTSTNMTNTTTRTRTESSASAASTISIRSRTESSASATQSSVPVNSIGYTRSRTQSSASASASTTSLASTSSVTPSSALSHNSNSSGSSNSTVPRPLRLPQTAGLSSIARSFSQDVLPSSSSSTFSSPTSSTTGNQSPYQRKRTLSGPRPLQPTLRSPSSLPQPGQEATIFTSERTLSPPPMNSPEQQTSPLRPITPTSPNSRPRPLVQPLGARPRPRTGTGMVYRTSTVTSLNLDNMPGISSHVTKLRELSLAASVSSSPYASSSISAGKLPVSPPF